ncbi:MAG: SAM-dependent methyltransferase [Muricauda sp.]|nr:SAM-dependent methyltransferase [Allomuricauda sp.]MBC29440.1 SAM-dependent methyltransferase [Allomuricauda sp.]
MNQESIVDVPIAYSRLLKKSKEIDFGMSSDIYIGTLLKTLVASKPKGLFLELGTGIGLSLSWMVDGMDEFSKLITLDNDSELIAIVNSYYTNDNRVTILREDGSKWIQNYQGGKFDLIFADAWPGKYSEIEETLNLVKLGGFYVIDDMQQQPNWPKGHEENVNSLVAFLENREDYTVTKMDWSTGVLIAVKTSNN